MPAILIESKNNHRKHLKGTMKKITILAAATLTLGATTAGMVTPAFANGDVPVEDRPVIAAVGIPEVVESENPGEPSKTLFDVAHSEVYSKDSERRTETVFLDTYLTVGGFVSFYTNDPVEEWHRPDSMQGIVFPDQYDTPGTKLNVGDMALWGHDALLEVVEVTPTSLAMNVVEDHPFAHDTVIAAKEKGPDEPNAEKHRTAEPDVATTLPGEEVMVNVLDNDTPTEGYDIKEFYLLDGDGNMTGELNLEEGIARVDGTSIAFTPAEHFTGDIELKYGWHQVDDFLRNGGYAESTVTVTVGEEGNPALVLIVSSGAATVAAATAAVVVLKRRKSGAKN